MKRREFIMLVGAAAAWPIKANAQQGERMRRVGVLSTGDDAEGQTRFAAFAQAPKQLGWSDGRNLRIDTRWATTFADMRPNWPRSRRTSSWPATGTTTVAPLLQARRELMAEPRREGYYPETGTINR